MPSSPSDSGGGVGVEDDEDEARATFRSKSERATVGNESVRLKTGRKRTQQKRKAARRDYAC